MQRKSVTQKKQKTRLISIVSKPIKLWLNYFCSWKCSQKNFVKNGHKTKFWVKKCCVKKFRSKKFVGSKKFWVKKIFGSKNFWVKNFFGSTKFLGQQNFWIKKYLGGKNLGSKTNFGSKNFLVQIFFGS